MLKSEILESVKQQIETYIDSIDFHDITKIYQIVMGQYICLKIKRIGNIAFHRYDFETSKNCKELNNWIDQSLVNSMVKVSDNDKFLVRGVISWLGFNSTTASKFIKQHNYSNEYNEYRILWLNNMIEYWKHMESK